MRFWILVVGSFALTSIAARLLLTGSAEQPLRWWFFWIGIAAATAGSGVLYVGGVGRIVRLLRKAAIAVVLQWALERTKLTNGRLAGLMQSLGLTRAPNDGGKAVPAYSRIDDVLMLVGWSAASIGAALVFASR
ncbi:hypothetical protein [Pinisolibacter aquiterrae]|uniref:hypothetical protein n=1 Tax=Pinisolibacter aquiterrae TaxID=2815579 RepID=UPI001C3D80E0|nr:hypothetical protein [Pinisolibacter aquiterrae]MBV5262472.1 hypothetical protein [Pinisolibacter aquiterrae]MCC8235892.1 hypothetical protein [Pinisolibacter aquiterrae]